VRTAKARVSEPGLRSLIAEAAESGDGANVRSNRARDALFIGRTRPLKRARHDAPN